MNLTREHANVLAFWRAAIALDVEDLKALAASDPTGFAILLAALKTIPAHQRILCPHAHDQRPVSAPDLE